jgi:flagellar hook assembly protein FlgD
MKKYLKSLAAIITALILSLSGSSVLSVFADNGLSIIYIGQPDDPSYDKYDYAAVIKFAINGYGGNRLAVEIADRDGELLIAVNSPLIKTNRAVWNYYWDGKSMDGLRYDDGGFIVSYWIEGRRKDTFHKQSYNLDLKGNSLEDNSSRTYMRLVYIGAPDDQSSPLFKQAFNVRVRYKYYKGEIGRIRIYDPTGRHVASFSTRITHDDYTYDYYWDGYDKARNFCKDGKYTVTYWVEGFDNYTNDSMVVKLRKPVYEECTLMRVFNTGNHKKGVMGFTVKVSGYEGKTLRAEVSDTMYGQVYQTYSYKIKTSNVAEYTWYWDGKLYDGTLARGGCRVAVWIDGYYAGTYSSEEIADVSADWDEEFPRNP